MAFAGFGLAAAVGISGCGSSSDGVSGESGSGAKSDGTPKGTVVAAFENLEASSNAGFTLSLDGTYEDFKKIDAAQPGSDALDASDEAALKQAFNGKVTMNVSAPEGKTFGDSIAESTAQQQDAQALLKDPAALEKALKGQAPSRCPSCSTTRACSSSSPRTAWSTSASTPTRSPSWPTRT